MIAGVTYRGPTHAFFLSFFLLGSETWNCTAADIRRLESFHNRCLRCMFGISRLTHFTNFDLRKLTCQQTIQSMMMNNRLRWLGHVMRMQDERMPKRMMFARLQTTRPAGGTQQRWKDCVQHDLRFMELEDGWSHLAQQRDKWHSTTEGAVRKWEAEKNAKEKEGYEQKKAGSGVKCSFRGCGFIAKNEKGLKSHWGQKHKFVDESSDDSDDDDDDDAAPRSSSSSSSGRSSSSSSSTTTTATTAGSPSSSSSRTILVGSSRSSTSSKYICIKCGKDCSSGSGLSSHLRHQKCHKAAADAPK